VTALAVPLLACLSGLQVPRQALASFANPVIFLFWVALLWRRLMYRFCRSYPRVQRF
jgi:di/tricarboxylate transporter